MTPRPDATARSAASGPEGTAPAASRAASRTGILLPMRVRIFQVDAFTDRRFGGNPAAVCLLDGWPEDSLLQAVAAENNLSETAFLVSRGEDFDLRWFTPEAEVELCGHATLAAGFVVLGYLRASRRRVTFHTAGGTLEVSRAEDRLAMDFPAEPPEPCQPPPGLGEALGAEPEEVLGGRDWLAVFGTRATVADLCPDMEELAGLDRRGVIVTAPAGEGEDADFVSRFFAPGVGVPEDPVTGSAHCALAPYWSRRLGRDRVVGRQISRRGGRVECELVDDRVVLGGGAVLYLEGWIRI